jgi:DNA-binding CsgD family transcriptional regulator
MQRSTGLLSGCTRAPSGSPEIRERLFMSVNTVKKYLSWVYVKVEVDGCADLAAQVACRDL